MGLSENPDWDEGRPRRLPSPLVSTRRWTGAQARGQLQCSLDLASPETVQALYVHVPFCLPRCPFCDLDCLSIAARAAKNQPDAFCTALRREIAWHAERRPLRGRRISTIHFGGGTPLSLGLRRVADVLAEFRREWGVGQSTEIAFEIRASDVTEETLAWFSQAGIRRLHVGVQTLQERWRMQLGRRGGGKLVLETLGKLLGIGAVVSADVLYGLPGQGPEDLWADLDALCSVGVHGVSLYELHKTLRNRRLFEDTWGMEPDRAANARLAVAGSRFLEARGYERRHFTHFARPEDEDLYSSHPTRGEECLAFGPAADGHAAGAAWRSLPYSDWLRAVAECGCGVASVSLYTPAEQALRQLESGLMMCHLAAGCVKAYATMVGRDGEAIIEMWSAADLVREAQGELHLTDKGIWLHGNMIESLRGLLRDSVATPWAATGPVARS